MNEFRPRQFMKYIKISTEVDVAPVAKLQERHSRTVTKGYLCI